MGDYIRIKKRDVRKILSLYTMEGLTQKQIAVIVLGEKDIKGVSTYTIVQRVLHYLGIDMKYRRNYKNEGLTDDIISIILDNRTLAFPLAIPTEGNVNSAIQFDAEVNKYLGNANNRWIKISVMKNIAVLSLMAIVTFYSMSYSDMVMDSILYFLTFGMVLFIMVIEGPKNRGIENTTKGEFFEIAMFLLFIVLMFIGAITNL